MSVSTSWSTVGKAVKIFKSSLGIGPLYKFSGVFNCGMNTSSRLFPIDLKRLMLHFVFSINHETIVSEDIPGIISCISLALSIDIDELVDF